MKNLLIFLAVAATAAVAYLVLQPPASMSQLQRNPVNPKQDAQFSSPTDENLPSVAIEKAGSATTEKMLAEGDNIFIDADPSLITGVDFNEFTGQRPYQRFRVVNVNSNHLREYIRNIADREPITLRLIDELITLLPVRGEEVADGWRAGYATLNAEIQGAKWSKVSMRIAPGGQVNGYFQSPDIGYVAIESIGDGSEHFIWKMRDDVEISIE